MPIINYLKNKFEDVIFFFTHLIEDEHSQLCHFNKFSYISSEKTNFNDFTFEDLCVICKKYVEKHHKEYKLLGISYIDETKIDMCCCFIDLSNTWHGYSSPSLKVEHLQLNFSDIMLT